MSDANVIFEPKKLTAKTLQRFRRRRTAELVQHVGGMPSSAQQILIARIVRNEWDLRRLDAAMNEGEISAHAMRTRLAMENRLRLDLRDLGLKRAEPRLPTAAEYLAQKARDRAGSQPEGAA